MKKGSVYIIPNDEILEDCFFHEVTKEHLEGFQAFSDRYKLGYSFTSADYQDAPCLLALDGHLVVRVEKESSSLIFYIPNEVNDRQVMWLHNMKDMALNYTTVGGYTMSQHKDEMVDEILYGIDNVIKRADFNNIFYNKRKGDQNVGKKI